MQSSRVTKAYRGYSCHQCHKQKIKCSREKPSCRNCALTSKNCTYVVHDRKVLVDESFLLNLQRGPADQAQIISTNDRDRSTEAAHDPTPAVTQEANVLTARSAPKHDPENSTIEVFVSKLKQIQGLHADDTRPSQSVSPSPGYVASETGSHRAYEYFTLNTDTPQVKCTFKLPPYHYAIFLLDQFSLYLSQDWHLFCLQQFRLRLQSTYMTVESAESKDRVWLCQLLIVLALAESVNAVRQPQISLGFDEQNSKTLEQNVGEPEGTAPGSEFFEQALRLLNLPFESASVEHVQALNMIVLYNNQLNRQKTAYMYAGQSARLCNMLQLHRQSSSRDCSPLEREHRKRIWWSTYSLDRMTSTSTGFLPTLHFEQTDLDYPSNVGLSTGDAQEFADPDYLTARIQLTIIEANNSASIATFRDVDKHDIETAIHPLLISLNTWKSALPAHMAMDMADGIFQSTKSLQRARSLANFHLRWNQSVILLTRPLLLRLVSRINSQRDMDASQVNKTELNDTCLKCARTSLSILLELRSHSLLVRLGFMENLHLFTALVVLCLATSINVRWPGSFEQNPEEDSRMYDAGKALLTYMMQSGSMAAKGHLSMLRDVEDLCGVIASNNGTASTVQGEGWNADEMDEWMRELLDGNNLAIGSELYPV